MGLTVQRQNVQLLVTAQQWLCYHSTVDSKCWQLWCTWEHIQYLAIFASSIISKNKITKFAHSLATVLIAAVLFPVVFVLSLGLCSAGSMVSPNAASIVCTLLGSPMTKEVPYSRLVHSVRGVHIAAIQGCPVLYSPQSYNKCEEINIFPTLVLMRALQFNVQSVCSHTLF